MKSHFNTPLDQLPPRIDVPVVLDLARFSKTTLFKRIKEKKFPQPIDRARKLIFRTEDVLQALGLSAKVDASNPWDKACGFDDIETA